MYTYTRDGQTVVIGADGFRATDIDGSVITELAQPLPADVIVGTVLDLILAGWVESADV
jgi:hypothetical protein